MLFKCTINNYIVIVDKLTIVYKNSNDKYGLYNDLSESKHNQIGNQESCESLIFIAYDAGTSRSLYQILYKELKGLQFNVHDDSPTSYTPDYENCKNFIDGSKYILVIIPSDITVMLKNPEGPNVFPQELRHIARLLRKGGYRNVYLCYEGTSTDAELRKQLKTTDTEIQKTINTLLKKRTHQYKDVTIKDSPSFIQLIEAIKQCEETGARDRSRFLAKFRRC